MKCKLQMKTNKNEEAFGGFEFGLTEMCFPSLGSRHKYKLTMILRQHYHYIGHLFTFFSHKLSFSYIGQCHENSFDK